MPKRIYAVNGSPRKNGSTAQVLQCALDGAAETGAATELIHLRDLDFSGCVSCFACKLKGGKSLGRCAVRDDLSPILEKLLNSDGIVMGSPVYFGAETGLFRNFMERLLFPLTKYSDPPESFAVKRMPLAFVYAMNVTEEEVGEYGYDRFMKLTRSFAKKLLSSREVETLCVCDTWQFDDYSRYESSRFDPVHKAEVREKRFPIDCRNAFELGKRIALGGTTA